MQKAATQGETQRERERERETQSDAETHVNVLGEQLVGGLVLLDGVVVYGGAGEGAAKEEAKQPIHLPRPAGQCQSACTLYTSTVTGV